jgi:hypothetical protein
VHLGIHDQQGCILDPGNGIGWIAYSAGLQSAGLQSAGLCCAGLASGRLTPWPPMRGAHVDRLQASRVDPSVENPAARKREHMWNAFVDDGEFQIAAERCGGYGLPHEYFVMQQKRPAP